MNSRTWTVEILRAMRHVEASQPVCLFWRERGKHAPQSLMADHPAAVARAVKTRARKPHVETRNASRRYARGFRASRNLPSRTFRALPRACRSRRPTPAPLGFRGSLVSRRWCRARCRPRAFPSVAGGPRGGPDVLLEHSDERDDVRPSRGRRGPQAAQDFPVQATSTAGQSFGALGCRAPPPDAISAAEASA